jgi:hypothetical protein
MTSRILSPGCPRSPARRRVVRARPRSAPGGVSIRWSVSGNNAGVRDIDLTDARIFGQGFPHDVFTTLRREAPVYWQAFPPAFPGQHDPGFWVLSRYEDVQAANRDAELFCSYDGPQLAIQPAMRGTMLVTMTDATMCANAV